MIEAQCPSCEAWACFTIADTPERQPKSDPAAEAAREAALKQRAALLFQPIERNRSHPAVQWFEKIGNGFFEDEYAEPMWPVPSVVYRFRRDRRAAYVWEEDGSWQLRLWADLGRSRPEPDIRWAATFEDALDQLLAEAR
jgi:hypothetical protein